MQEEITTLRNKIDFYWCSQLPKPKNEKKCVCLCKHDRIQEKMVDYIFIFFFFCCSLLRTILPIAKGKNQAMKKRIRREKNGTLCIFIDRKETNKKWHFMCVCVCVCARFIQILGSLISFSTIFSGKPEESESESRFHTESLSNDKTQKPYSTFNWLQYRANCDIKLVRISQWLPFGRAPSNLFSAVNLILSSSFSIPPANATK